LKNRIRQAVMVCSPKQLGQRWRTEVCLNQANLIECVSRQGLGDGGTYMAAAVAMIDARKSDHTRWYMGWIKEDLLHQAQRCVTHSWRLIVPIPMFVL
jgi:hypothetical protein